MATYAAVVSLMNTMDAAMNDPHISTCFHRQQIQSLGDNLDVLLQFIENYDFHSLRRDEEAQGLERRIRSAAHASEDVIELHIVAQVNAGVLQDAPTSCVDLHQIMNDIEEIKEEVVKVAEKIGSNGQTTKISPPQPRQTAGKMTMIGFDDYRIQLLDGLTGSESGRQVIPIVGMGGVGKTTLTKNAYENVQLFDVRVWISISQQYDVKNILIQLLSSLGQSNHENKNEGELSECLHKYLYGRRYLVVLDDMWSITPWEEIQFCFPENSNGSRIIVTTRLLEVANGFRSSRVVMVGMLDDNKSWGLFCDKAFAQHGGVCPNELEQIGKTIVKKCKGLPLSIVVIGALLGRSPQTEAYWENIAENMSSILSSGDEDCLEILCLSYYHLPAHLKPCFLYLGIFSEDHEISVELLIKLWIAEGFIKPNKDEMLLEDMAEGFLNDLLERSLILVDSLGWNKKLSSFHIHDLVRDMCLREAQKEKFYFVISRTSSEQEVEVERGIVDHQGCLMENDSYRFTSAFARSLICERFPPLRLRVCVVNDSSVHIDKFFNYFQNINTRLICCMENDYDILVDLPPSIFLLWNLQALILNGYFLSWTSPIEIWKMRQLRHIEFDRISLSEPPLSDDEDEFVVLHNLQTLMRVHDFRCSEEVCKRIPNIKRLEVIYEDSSKNSNEYFCLQNFGRLNKLEFLFFSSMQRGHLLQNLTLPTSLKELSLFKSSLDNYDKLTIIGSLPNLEVLKLICVEVSKGFEWNCVEGEFRALKILEIWVRNLITWNAERCHFPVLETLSLKYLDSMEEIPLGIGDIPTLTIVRLLDCNTTLMISTMKMLEEQENQGNDQIHVELVYSKKHLVDKMMEEAKEAFTCTNFCIRKLFSSSFM